MPKATTLAIALAIAAVFMAARAVTGDRDAEREDVAAVCSAECERHAVCLEREGEPGADGWDLPDCVEPGCECPPRMASLKLGSGS